LGSWLQVKNTVTLSARDEPAYQFERLAAMTYSRLKAELAEESEEVIAAMGQVKQDEGLIAQGL
tara:strand:- start:15 stop:206 length:192 start_codon:yes stop_codon:yes gene_type:complete